MFEITIDSDHPVTSARVLRQIRQIDAQEKGNSLVFAATQGTVTRIVGCLVAGGYTVGHVRGSTLVLNTENVSVAFEQQYTP